MATLQRFQILSSARQDLFQPESPVWVSRCQLSLDTESGKRLLQARMVNCSERTVRQVFLRIVCLGANRERLSQLEMVPMQSLSVLPGRVFGDDKLVEVPVRGTVFTEVYAQRVRFADDTTWDETDPDGYLPFRAVPVRESDPHAGTLSDRARSGGVRNDCYFRAQQGLWICTCGMPNATRALRCTRCGADKLWLEKHMDPNLIDAPEPVRAAAPAAAPASVPAMTVVPAPIRSEPPAQPTIIVQHVPEPEPEETTESHAGRNAAIIFAVLLFLALGAYCAWRYLQPYLRYQEALRERSAGNYDRAVALLEDIKTYRDSPEQIAETLARKALGLMGEGKYAEAMEILENLEGHDAQIADCLYSLGVLAYNDKDPAAALEYVGQLRERFPDYDKTETLAQYCYYSLGSEAVSHAAEVPGDPFLQRQWFSEAKGYFSMADGYEDSAERIAYCDYRIAGTYRDDGDLAEAISAYEALGDYSDAPTQRQACMFDYVQQHVDDYLLDALAPGYLTELAAANYPGAQELLDRLNGVGFEFRVVLSEEDPQATEASDLSQVTISYSIKQKDADGAVLVLVRYRLPNEYEGRSLLNANHEASGVKGWRDFPFPANCTKSGPVTLEFFDAARGETEDALLDSVVFPYVYEPPTADDTPSDAGNGRANGAGEGNTAPTGEASPGTGRSG